jgi:hypothetical protein
MPSASPSTPRSLCYTNQAIAAIPITSAALASGGTIANIGRHHGKEIPDHFAAQDGTGFARTLDIRPVRSTTMIASTARRVEAVTASQINQQIRRQTQSNVERYSSLGLDAIGDRLVELDNEWDIERYLETAAPTISLIGLGMGLLVNPKWLLVPIVVQSFFLLHGVQGWAPPIPILRRLGVRTMAEIDEERQALKALRGDYRNIPGETRDIEEAMLAVER